MAGVMKAAAHVGAAEAQPYLSTIFSDKVLLRDLLSCQRAARVVRAEGTPPGLQDVLANAFLNRLKKWLFVISCGRKWCHDDAQAPILAA